MWNWWIWRYGGEATWWLKLLMGIIGVTILLPGTIFVIWFFFMLWSPLGWVAIGAVFDIILTLIINAL